MDGMKQLFEQAQQMKQQMEVLQKELASTIVEESSGGGMVYASVNGQKKLLSLKIDPSVVNSEDIEMLQDLVVAAVNKAMQTAEESYKEKMGSMMPANLMNGMSNLF